MKLRISRNIFSGQRRLINLVRGNRPQSLDTSKDSAKEDLVRIRKQLRRGLVQLGIMNRLPPNAIHFLHIGKAAGSQINEVARKLNHSRADRPIVLHGHPTELIDLPPNDDYFFSTRDPATRFKSSFYSRLRKGQPRNFVDWSRYEKLAFERFHHANDLAEALFLPGQDGRDATAAMRSIRHCSRNLVDWFRFCGHMFEVRPPVWIIRQEHFATDLGVFLERIGQDPSVYAPKQSAPVHTNSYEDVPDLSNLALDNLRQWYAQDYAFLELCEAWMEQAR